MTNINTNANIISTGKPIDFSKFSSDLSYKLCEQNGEPLGPRRLKFIERAIAAGETRRVFILRYEGYGELRTCNEMYYGSLVYFHVIFQPE